MTSPPSRVINLRIVESLMVCLRKRTEPSAKAARKPFLVMPPSFGSGFLGSYDKSTGLVHGTASAASTIRIVFDVPSVISLILLALGLGKMVPAPVKT